MKKFLIATVIIISWAGCKPDVIKPFNLSEGSVSISTLQGNWKVSKVTVTDKTAADKNFPYQKMDITSDFGLNKMVLSLTTNQNAPTVFSTNYNGAVALFSPASGTWRSDNNDKPGILTFLGSSDTTKTTLGSYTSFQQNKMILIQNKMLEGKVVTIYEYEFDKQ